MIISNSRRFIFCHLHKTGGSSVTEALEPHLAWNDLVLGTTPIGALVNDPYALRFGLDKHSSAEQIRSVVREDIWRAYFTFAFVRHPFHRVRSLYHYLERLYVRKGGGRFRGRLARWRDPGRAPWSWPGMRVYVETRCFAEFIRHPGLSGAIAAQSQHAMLRRHDTDEVDLDFVGRVERLEEDFRIVAARVGAPEAQLVRRNQSRSSTEARERFSDRDREHLADLYRDDLEYFGYSADVAD